MARPLPNAVAESLRAEFPDGLLSLDPSELAEYGRDWTRVHTPDPCAVAFPRSTAEVSRIVALCNAHGVGVVPSGGRTGLAAGAVAARGELVLTLSRMRRMDPVDLLGQTVRVQAGAVTEAVHQHCAEHGLTWPVDFASKGSSEVGGNIATNAGGVRVIRYGLTRQWVLGLEVVVASGEVLQLPGALEKNNTGCDLRQLFIGSEGTLGVVTEATLKLTRAASHIDVLLFAVADIPAVLRLFSSARAAPFIIGAFEFFTDLCAARVERHRKLRPPFESPAGCYVLIEAEAHDHDALEAWAAGVLEEQLATEGTLAQNGTQAAGLWALRESISESLSGTGLPHKNDVALPIAALDAFTRELLAVFVERYPGWEVCIFGHIGDGNLHINVMKPDAMSREEFLSRTHDADHAIFALVQRHGGSISAEHGIGLLKKDYLAYTRSPGEIALLRALKRTLDPNNTLNPGKVLDP